MDSAGVGKNGRAIPGRLAAGEVAGGVHGNNRLGGNSLSVRVVFGRVAGEACAKYRLSAEPVYVAIITPVNPYCKGGSEIEADSAGMGKNGKAIPGLYAAGEVAGGVHGNNRLGGNSLSDCVVFGRVAGEAGAKYRLGADVKDTSLAVLSGGGSSGAVQSSKCSRGDRTKTP